MGSVIEGFMLQVIMLKLILFFQSTNFNELINDFIPRSSKNFTKKE
jgi:hypothetical protein